MKVLLLEILEGLWLPNPGASRAVELCFCVVVLLVAVSPAIIESAKNAQTVTHLELQRFSLIPVAQAYSVKARFKSHWILVVRVP